MTASCPLCGETRLHGSKPYPGGADGFLGIEAIGECDRCKLGYACPMPSADAVDRYYTEDSYAMENQAPDGAGSLFFQRLAASRIRRIVPHLPPGGPRRCLDVGAGRAVFGTVLKTLAPDMGYDVVEPSPECRGGYGQWVDQAYAEIDDVPSERRYALITLNQVVEHLVDPVATLRKLIRRAAPGGIVFIEVPYRDDLYKTDATPHLTFWSPFAMRFLAERAAGRVVFCDSAGMPREYAAKYFQRRFSWAERIADVHFWRRAANRLLGMLPVSARLDDTGMFAMDTYGGDRQWLRCVMTPVRE